MTALLVLERSQPRRRRHGRRGAPSPRTMPGAAPRSASRGRADQRRACSTRSCSGRRTTRPSRSRSRLRARAAVRPGHEPPRRGDSDAPDAVPLAERAGRPRPLDRPRPPDARPGPPRRSRRSTPIVAHAVPRRSRRPTGVDRHIQNRNALLWLYPGAFGQRPGSRRGPAPAWSPPPNGTGGGSSRSSSARPASAFSDAAALLDHGFAAFAERTFVAAGEPTGAVALRGGTFPGEAGARLAGARPDRRAADVREHVVGRSRRGVPAGAGGAGRHG